MHVSLRQLLFDAFDADEFATVVAIGDIVLVENPDDVHVLIRLGAVQSALAQYDIAQELLGHALRVAPAAARHIVLSHFGDLYKNRGDLAAAAKYYGEASLLMPDDATYYIYRGAALARLGRLKEAEAAHRMATKCPDGCIDEAYCNLGLILRSQGRLPEARRCFEKAIEIDPHYESAILALQDIVKALGIVSGTDIERGVGYRAADDADSHG